MEYMYTYDKYSDALEGDPGKKVCLNEPGDHIPYIDEVPPEHDEEGLQNVMIAENDTATRQENIEVGPEYDEEGLQNIMIAEGNNELGPEPVAADTIPYHEEVIDELSPLQDYKYRNQGSHVIDVTRNNSVTRHCSITYVIPIMTLLYISCDSFPSDDIIFHFGIVPVIRNILVPPLIIRMMVRIQRIAKKVITWCDEHQALVYIIISTIGIVLFLGDMSSDVILGVSHYQNGDIIWFSITIIFVAAPAIPGNILTILALIRNTDISSVGVQCVLLAAALIVGPLGMLAALVFNLYSSIRRYPHHKAEAEAVFAAALIKLFEVCLESYPQAALQMFIAFQDLEAVTWLTWVTIAFSLVTLSFGIATSFMFTEASGSSKLTFILLGIISSSSRLLVCSVWSMSNKYLWFLVFGSQITASISTWATINWCRPCSVCPPLVSDHRSDIAILFVPLTWLITVSVNCVTVGGLAVSTTTLLYAIAGCCLGAAPLAVSITALILATLACLANVCMLTLEQCEGLKNDYLFGFFGNQDHETLLY